MLAIGAVSRMKLKLSVLEQGRVDRGIAAGNEERVTVGGCPNDRLGADIGAGAWTVLNEKLLAEALRQPLADQTRGDVVCATGRNGDDDTHRPRRIGLRPRNARQRPAVRQRPQPIAENLRRGSFMAAPIGKWSNFRICGLPVCAEGGAMSPPGRLCCKSRFALVIKNSAGCRRGFRVKM